MKANDDKGHLLVSSDESCAAKIENFSIKKSTKEKLLGVKFDPKLSFLKIMSPFFVKKQARTARYCKNITLHGLK